MSLMSIFLLAAASSWCLLLLLIPQLRRRFPDHPNPRSSHLQPTPRGGGIVFVLLGSVSSGFALFSGEGFTAVALPLLATPLAVIGLLDDRHGLPASWRYGVQFCTAALILWTSPLVNEFISAVAVGRLFSLFLLALLVISVTAVINFTNFMDGIDGLVSGCMAIAISALCLELDLSWSLWALVGALLGFLLWNWSPAKVFMGDVGSTFLGAVFAGLVLNAPTWS